MELSYCHIVKECYKDILRIRLSEQYIINNYQNNEMRTPMHMSMGDEAAVVGVVSATRTKGQFFGYYRSHSPYIAITRDLTGFFLELYGRSDAPNGGRAGSMHLCNPSRGLVMTSAIVSSTIAPAVGAAFGARYISDSERVVVCFFGDGAMEEGVFWESLNIASVKNLPIIFVLLDNQLAVDIEPIDRQGFSSVKDLCLNFRLNYYFDESSDVMRIQALTKEALRTSSENQRPVFMHLRYYRFLQHIGISTDFESSKSDTHSVGFERIGYRSAAERDLWSQKDPLKVAYALALDALTSEDLDKARSSVQQELEQALEKVHTAPAPSVNDLYRHLMD